MDAPDVDLLLEVDREYREKAQAAVLPLIAPRRMNPEHKAWLPVLHKRHDGGGQATVVTERRGILSGKRVVRGREPECARYYRRGFLQAGLALAALAWMRPAFAQAAKPVLTVHLGKGCDCCRKWVAHMAANGFRAEVVEHEDVSAIKRKLGVPAALASCHTATVNGYVIEGHVPAADVKRLLREGRAASGLAVPGMVPGSPGMEGSRSEAYATLVFDASGSRVFARH